ncbi:MAG: HAD family hydrolase, partial [Nitrososphaeraceae archaeon]
MRGIIFDLDGVLTDSMPAHYKAWEIAFKEV